jgi:hypothetical protein
VEKKADQSETVVKDEASDTQTSFIRYWGVPAMLREAAYL